LWSVSAAAGLQLVKDFSNPNDFIGGGSLAAVGNKVFFTIFDGNTGEEDLWQSDGTQAGTTLVKANVFTYASSEVAVGDKLFFVNVDPNTSTYQLWESDGTDSSTHVVDPNNPGSFVFDLTNVNDTLYYFDASFDSTTGILDLQLRKTGGTTTTQVADMGSNFFPAGDTIITLNVGLLRRH
jgi:ELWxxDGT repeat protein